MNYIPIILSVYMTLLSLLPCQDSNDLIASVAQITIQKTSSCNDHDKKESCPPFCTCSCCSNARFVLVNESSTLFSKPLSSIYPDFQIPAVQEQTIKIWQPPQIA